MIICKTQVALQKVLLSAGHYSKIVGFVPTMGALHEGHLSLIEAAKKKCKIVVASIFVNPTQFNDPKDFTNYPVNLAADIQLLASVACDILFLPPVSEMYPEGLHHLEQYELGAMEHLLEGPYRPGHFQGVCQVMSRLLQLVKPGQLFMGSKDYQQCMVVQQLIGQLGLPVMLHKCPTLREPDGLAMSSRNTRLSAQARQQSTAIYRQIINIIDSRGTDTPAALEAKAANNLLDAGFSAVDYVSIAHPDTLEPLRQWEPNTPIVVLIAAFIDGVRLIDNMVSNP